jgi:hypothetical protein
MKNDYDDDREVIIAAHPLLDYCREHGWELRRDGSGRWKCLCPLHQEDTASFTINPEKNLFYCFGCKAGGSVIDLHMRLRGIDKGAAMRELSPNSNKSSNYMKTTKKSTPALDAIPKREVAAYDYQDATGRVRFQVIRYEYMDPATGDTKKTFKQCRIVDGVRDWDSKMDGVERLLYRLPEVVAVGETEVWIVEGEKDVETLRAVKQVATCNPGGAAKWLPAFSQDLKDKCIYLVPDRDKPGEDHARDVLQSLAGIVRWVKWVELPPELKGAPVKDISDLRAACKSDESFGDTLELLKAKARLIERGIESRAYTMLELEAQFIAEITAFADVSLDLNRWLPELNLLPLGPGDLLGIIANTGQCKTAAVQNILACNADIAGIFFELELTGPQMFVRAAAISTGYDAWKISQDYREGFVVDWKTPGKFKNLLTCIASLSMAEIDAEIGRSSAKLGCLPRVFVIDYVQLVRAHGSRYDRMSDTCEEAKRLAKKWNAIGIIISQVSRPAKDSEDSEVSLYDAKESGSFENSCGLVLGVWKKTEAEMVCKVLKNTRGYAGREVPMLLRGNTYIIEPDDFEQAVDHEFEHNSSRSAKVEKNGDENGEISRDELKAALMLLETGMTTPQWQKAYLSGEKVSPDQGRARSCRESIASARQDVDQPRCAEALRQFG